MYNIFQTPWPLITAAVGILVILTVFRLGWPEKKRLWQLLLPPMLALTALGLDFFVKTDYEKIEVVIQLGFKAVADEDVDSLAKLLSDDYSDTVHHSKKRFVSFCQALFSEPLVEKVKLRYNKITVAGSRADAIFEAAVHLESNPDLAISPEIVFVKMKFDFTKTTHKIWLIQGSQIRAINNNPCNWNTVK